MYFNVLPCVTTFLTIIEFGFRHLKNYGDRGGCYLKSQICILTR